MVFWANIVVFVTNRVVFWANIVIFGENTLVFVGYLGQIHGYFLKLGSLGFTWVHLGLLWLTSVNLG